MEFWFGKKVLCFDNPTDFAQHVVDTRGYGFGPTNTDGFENIFKRHGFKNGDYDNFDLLLYCIVRKLEANKGNSFVLHGSGIEIGMC